MKVLEALRRHHYWKAIENDFRQIDQADHRAYGQWFLCPCVDLAIHAYVVEHTKLRSPIIGNEDLPTFTRRWADRTMHIAWYDWSVNKLRHYHNLRTYSRLAAAVVSCSNSPAEDFLSLGAGLVAGLDSEESDASQVIDYLGSALDFTFVGVRLDLQLAGLMPISDPTPPGVLRSGLRRTD